MIPLLLRANLVSACNCVIADLQAPVNGRQSCHDKRQKVVAEKGNPMKSLQLSAKLSLFILPFKILHWGLYLGSIEAILMEFQVES